MDAVIATLNRWQSMPYVWGQSDCILVLADRVLSCTGVDPASDFRFGYSSAGECQRLTKFFTEPLSAIGPPMDAIAQRSNDPKRGDVGILLSVSGAGSRPYGAMCLGGMWAAFSEDSGVMVHCAQKILVAWSIPDVSS